MLPKEEKIKKSPENAKQPGLFDKEDEKKRLKRKRTFVTIALFLTVGLSLSFWIYRSLKDFKFSFKLPTINLPKSPTKTSSLKVSSSLSLPKDGATWSIFLKQNNSDTVIFQKDQDLIFSSKDLSSILEEVERLNLVKDSTYSSTLPQGLKIKEISQKDDKTFFYFSKINSPSQDLILFIKISDSSNLDQSIQFVPDLINQLYWYSL